MVQYKEKAYGKVAKWVVENNASMEETLKHFNLDSSAELYSLLSSLKRASSAYCKLLIKDGITYEKVKSILNSKRRRYKADEVYDYIKENKPTLVQVLEEFDYDKSDLIDIIKTLKKHDKKIYNELMKFIDDQDEAAIDVEVVPKYAKVAEYIINNNASLQQAREHFNMTKATMSSNIVNLKKYSIILYNQVREIIDANSKYVPKVRSESIPKYIQATLYIIENNANIEETAEYMQVDTNNINAYIYIMLKKYKPKLFDIVTGIFEMRSAQLPREKREKMANYILDNDLTMEEAMEHFKLSNKAIIARISDLKEYNSELAEKVRKHLAPKRYEIVADYILKNKPTMKEVMKAFDMSRNLAYVTVHNLKDSIPEKYEEIIASIRK